MLVFVVSAADRRLHLRRRRDLHDRPQDRSRVPVMTEATNEQQIQAPREALVRHPHLLGLREEGQGQPRAPHRVDGHGRQDLPGPGARRGRDRDPRRPAGDRPEEGLPRLRAGGDDPRPRLLVRRAQHARRDQLRGRGQHPRRAATSPSRSTSRGQADPAPDGRGDAQDPGRLPEGPERARHGRPVRRVHRHRRRGQPGAQQGQGAGQHLRPRDAGRARLPADREACRGADRWPRRSAPS